MSSATALLAIERNLQLIEELNAENRRMLAELASVAEDGKLITIVTGSAFSSRAAGHRTASTAP